jgi:hypothetical protein
MPKVVALFNLKQGVRSEDYEQWARTTDLPTVKGLQSVDEFSALRSVALLGSDGVPPYQYVEVIDINDMGVFGQELSEATMQRVAAEFQQFADNPCFILTEDL